MNATDASICLTAIGYRVDRGYIFYDKFRYGKIDDDAYTPEGEDATPISWSEIVGFSDSYEGASGHYLEVTFVYGPTERMPRADLPESSSYSGMKLNPKGQGFLMPTSLLEMKNAWRYVFPEFNDNCWKDATSGIIMVNQSMIGGKGVVELTDELLIRIAINCQEKLTKLGCVGTHTSDKTISKVLIAEAECNVRNAFLDMMRSRTWDKTPRLDRLFIDVFGAKMHGLSDEDSDAVLKKVCKCWFIGGVARQFKPVQLDIVPVMIGATGSRKTTAVKWMATCDEFYRDILDPNEKRFVEDTKGGLVVELPEMKAVKGKDADYLKGLISRATDFIRLPYARFSTNNIRRHIIIGTTNDVEFLTDPTGNRRFFPFEVNPEKATIGFGKEKGFRSEEAKEYILQVWAEAYFRYMNGETWELDTETLTLATKCQEASMIYDPNVDMLSQLVDKLFPLVGDVLCMKDLIFIAEQNCVAFSEDAVDAARTWWKTPQPCWGSTEQIRLKADDRRGWLKEPSISMKCRVRTQPVGWKEPALTRHLGE